MPTPLNRIQPDRATALCTREQAERLLLYDHHVVQAGGREGVMLTAEWMPLEEHSGPFVLTVVFRHVQGHPPAPPAIQSLVNGLRFRVHGQPR